MTPACYFTHPCSLRTKGRLLFWLDDIPFLFTNIAGQTLIQCLQLYSILLGSRPSTYRTRPYRHGRRRVVPARRGRRRRPRGWGGGRRPVGGTGRRTVRDHNNPVRKLKWRIWCGTLCLPPAKPTILKHQDLQFRFESWFDWTLIASRNHLTDCSYTVIILGYHIKQSALCSCTYIYTNFYKFVALRTSSSAFWIVSMSFWFNIRYFVSYILGPKLLLVMGCVKLGEKNCVHLASVGEQTAN